MSSRVPSRPRRTRIYGANYNIGESYYKSALEDLDRKRYGRPPVISEPSVGLTPHTRAKLDDTFDDELQQARFRARRAITEEPPLFDSRGGRLGRGFPLSSAFGDDDLDEDASLNRIRATRQKNMSSLMNELDLEDSFSKIKRRANLDLGDKLLDVAGEDDIGSSIRSRALKMVSQADEDDTGSSFRSRGRRLASRIEDDEPAVASRSMVSSYKRTTISDASESSNSAASLRAKATKARLADIETDMFERSEKLMEREKRAANLKKLLADNDIDEVKATKKVTF